MKIFDVLDRHLNVHDNYLLEASAGTGKTFSIENIVVRLLIEPPELLLGQILIVTFTRAAARDLRKRIRKNIKQAHSLLSHYLKNHACSPETPDFLLKICENGVSSVSLAKRQLEQALFCFDTAAIFTIHGFCNRMLCESIFEANMGLMETSNEEPLPDELLNAIINDYFRSKKFTENLSISQLEKLIKANKGSLDLLKRKLSKYIKQGVPFLPTPAFDMSLNDFYRIMSEIKPKINSEGIVSDFITLAKYYKGLCGKNGIKEEKLATVVRFALLFNKDAWNENDFNGLIQDGLLLCEAYDPSNRDKRKSIPDNILLNNCHITDILMPLSNCIQMASNPDVIFARLAGDCQRFCQKYLAKEEKLGPDDLLKRMHISLANEAFVERIRKRYQVAIIDEFQDTDPLQWEIFKTIFLNNDDNHRLYLVGDPKQSIYAFRQADIYTYLNAGQTLGKENQASLNVNWRSQEKLIKALNAVFNEDTTSGLISLPKINGFLPYKPVLAAQKSENISFNDDFGAFHWVIAHADEKQSGQTNKSYQQIEEDVFFPFFVQEIIKLTAQNAIPLNAIALLVKDQYQGQRLAEYLKKYQLPCSLQKNAPLTESPALPALIEIIQAVLHPRQESTLKLALSNAFWNWSYEEILTLTDPLVLEKVLAQCQSLRKTLFEDGFAAFFQSLLSTSMTAGKLPPGERLLQEHDGIGYLRDLQQIADILIVFQSTINASPEKLLAHLKNMLLSNYDELGIKKRSNPNENALHILTMHASKGLEYDVVFIPGIFQKPPSPEKLLPVSIDSRWFIKAIIDEKDPDYIAHCLELDAEKIRQLYVAMTRAKYRLYVPVIIFPKPKNLSLGDASPIDLLLARLNQPTIDAKDIYERINVLSAAPILSIVDKVNDPKSMTFSLFQHPLPPPQKYNSSENIDLIANDPPKIIVGPLAIHSFTSLSKAIKASANSTKDNPPHNFQAEVRTPFTLPSGSETGILLHTLFENINFSDYLDCSDPEQLQEFIHAHIFRTSYHAWENVFCDILFRCMKTPLISNFHSFSLCEIKEDCMLRETEFLMQTNDEFFMLQSLSINNTIGYLKGVIDLAFFHNGRYYLLDWKSNWLGPSFENYNTENMHREMEQEAYYLQAKLYAHAFERYLKHIEKRPFNECFGGVFYLFVRGVSSTTGIIYMPPEVVL